MAKKESQKSLIGYFRKRSTSFFKRLQETKDELGVEDIHQLRVETKKMRAVLRLLEIISDNQFDKKSHLEFILKLFKAAGRLREIQVNLGIVYLYPPTPFLAFKNHLLEAEEHAFKEFQIVLERFPTEQLQYMNTHIEPLIASIKPAKIHLTCHHFISERLQNIDVLRQEFYKKESPHDIRILLKAIAAILKLWHELLPHKELKKAIKQITPVAELIGDWHDTFVLHKAMKKFYKANTLLPKSSDFKQRMKVLKKSSIRMLNEIEMELDSIFPLELPPQQLEKDPQKSSEIFLNV
jgi:CHAD domain-containing protein